MRAGNNLAALWLGLWFGLWTPVWCSACPPVGAIRWDAWFGGAQGAVGKVVEQTLSPERWHARLPECARALGSGQVAIRCATQAQMDREIKLAVTAGLGFWAFMTYAEDDSMSLGLQHYLHSKAVKRPRFALIADPAALGSVHDHKSQVERYARLMAAANYQRTADGRPLFFLGFVSDERLHASFGGRKGFATVIEDLRRTAERKGAGKPYMILLERDPVVAKSLVQAFGFDAVSAYAVADGQARQAPYRSLAALAEQFWNVAGKAGVPVIPIAMAGRDRRPRVMHPVPWEQADSRVDKLDHYYELPTDSELARHITQALRFAQSNAGKSSGPAPAVLVYAWNEFDEGGWLAPTLGKPRGRLDAVAKALETACPRSRP